RRGQRRAACQLLADRQRSFAVAVAPQAEAGGVGGAERGGGRSAVRSYPGRRRVEGKQAVARVVVTVRQIGRQRNVLLIDRVTQLQREIFAELEAETRTEAYRPGAVGDVAVRQLLAVI